MAVDQGQLIRRSSSGSVKRNTRCTRWPSTQRVHPECQHFDFRHP
jgi:hypothetical protein